MKRKRIVITGMGVVSGYGKGKSIFWEGLRRGKSCVRHFDRFDSRFYPVQIAAQVPDLPPQEKWTRCEQMAWLAIEEAWEEAFGGEKKVNPNRVSYVGSVGWNSPEEKSANKCLDKALEDLIGIKGVIHSSFSACAATTQGIGDGARLIQTGQADVCLVGGSDTRLYPLGLLGYSMLSALTTEYNNNPEEASRPFDQSRSGFVMGEGAGFLVLESWEHAKQRKKMPIAEIAGWASTSDAYRVTDPEPSGEQAVRCMRQALKKADMKLEEVDYVNAHGTSTVLNDRVEARNMAQVFGGIITKKKTRKRVTVSSFKSMMGHLSMASGVVEVIGATLAMQHRFIPPTINLEKLEEEAQKEKSLFYVANLGIEQDVRVVLKNSFGFGGQNASIVLKKWKE